MAEETTNRPPNVVKRILCLANSRKLSGRCVAGREIANPRLGPWVRPVSSCEHQWVGTKFERSSTDRNDRHAVFTCDKLIYSLWNLILTKTQELIRKNGKLRSILPSAMHSLNFCMELGR